MYSLNPMVAVVEGFRWALLDTDSLTPGMLVASGVVALVLSLGGLFYFGRIEHEFADVV